MYVYIINFRHEKKQHPDFEPEFHSAEVIQQQKNVKIICTTMTKLNLLMVFCCLNLRMQ